MSEREVADPKLQKPFRRGVPPMLLTASCAVVVVAALKLAQTLLLPVLIAAFIATVSYPITRWLRDHGVPRFFAVFLTVLVDFAFLTATVLLALALAGDFQHKWKGENGEVGYEKLMWEKVQRSTQTLNDWTQYWGFEEGGVELEIEPPEAVKEGGSPAGGAAEAGLEGEKKLRPGEAGGLVLSNRLQEELLRVDFGRMWDFGTNVAFGLVSLAGTALLILILTIFMLAESRMFGRQLVAILEARGPDLGHVVEAAQNIQRYLGIKTVISLATGLLAGFLCWAAGLDFYVLWGIVAFVLNFIPVVGSIIAGVPPVILALLVQEGVGGAVAVIIGYTSVNVLLGNFLEPMLMGRRFGLSTLVVLLAVLFWGWLWGPAGMLLAVPLTMVVKTLLETSPDLRWLSVAMSKERVLFSSE